MRIITGNTVIKTITVGTPIKTPTAGAFTIFSINGVDMSNLQNGALLVYNSTSENFEATTNIDNTDTNLNGGNF